MQKKEKLIEANKIVGFYALNSANYELAEKAYKKLITLDKNPEFLNLLAESLENGRKFFEAGQIRAEIITKYENSKNEKEKYEAIKALLKQKDEISQLKAFNKIKELLQINPDNPDYQYTYAVIKGQSPRYKNDNEPIQILSNLSKKYPANLEYSLGAINIMNKKLINNEINSKEDIENLNSILIAADKLIANFQNTPKVVISYADLKTSYIRFLRKNGDLKQARKEFESLTGRLELLFYNKETPDIIKERLITMQFERLNLFLRDKNKKAAFDMAAKIESELGFYSGRKLLEFKTLLNDYKNNRQ